jgi:hypothetical protein
MWLSNIAGEPALFVLMPFGTKAGVQGFNLRVQGWLQSRYAATFDQLKIDPYIFTLLTLDDIEQLRLLTSGRL